MKFTDEDLMKAMGLQVGDKIRVKCIDGQFNETFETYEIKQGAGDTYIQSINDGFIDSLAYLIDQEFEILPKPKRIGDKICNCQSCAICPLRMIDCLDEFGIVFDNMTLYEILDFKNKENNDQEIYDLLKARLDKEVQDNDK